MGLPLTEAVSAVAAVAGMGSATRGHPRGACPLPCAELKQSGRTVRVRYDDLAYLTRYELTMRLYADTPQELDAVSPGAVAALERLGFTLEDALEYSDADGFQRVLRLSYQD